MRLDGNKLVVVAMGLAVLAVISTYSGCSKPPETVKPKPDAPVITINVAPDLNLQSLVASGEPAAIDYILDGSASMCGYFKAGMTDKSLGLHIIRLLQEIKSVHGEKDHILIFSQTESAQKANYIPFEEQENALMQGSCNFQGQYTQLGLILQDYRSKPELRGRSVVIISDMHLLPNELTTLAQEFQYWTTDYLNRPNNQGLSNGLLSIRAPFNGTYFSVNNDKHQMENTKKHLHLLWLATNQQSASQFSTLHQQLTQLNKTDVPNALFAQAEFLPQVRLLVDDAKRYEQMSGLYLPPKPDQIIDLSDASKTTLSSYANNPPLEADQLQCFELGWSDDHKALHFYPYKNRKLNTDQTCGEGPLFRSQTGSTIQINLPTYTGYDITMTSNEQRYANGIIQIPLVDHKPDCIGVSKTSNQSEAKYASMIQLTLKNQSTLLNTAYYGKFSLAQDKCNSQDKCPDLVDKTFEYESLVKILATKSKQAIDVQYPKKIDIPFSCQRD